MTMDKSSLSCAQLSVDENDNDHSSSSSSSESKQRLLVSTPGSLGFCSAHTLINKERALRGRSSLKRSVESDEIRLDHAQTMAEQLSLMHSASSLEALQDVVQSPIVGENIQRGASVQEMHDEFMNNETAQQRRRRDCASKQNILGKQFTEFGIGTAKGSDGKLYMVQLFRGSATTPPQPPQADGYKQEEDREDKKEDE